MQHELTCLIRGNLEQKSNFFFLSDHWKCMHFYLHLQIGTERRLLPEGRFASLQNID